MEIVSGRGLNGAVVHCRLLAVEMIRAGHEVTVVSRPGAWILDHLPSQVQTLSSTLERNRTELRRMKQILIRERYDVIHTHMSSAHFFGVLMRLLTGLPSVATAHNQRLQLHWRFNDRVIVTSRSAARYHRRVNRVPPRRLHTIYNFVDTDRWRCVDPATADDVRRELGIARSAIVIGCVGDVIERKGLIFLVPALAGIIRTHPDAVLLVLGGGEDGAYARRVQQEADRMGIANHIVWTGARDDIPRLLQAVDIFALPSLRECMPLSILEAMAIGLPVVATRVGGIPEAVVSGQTGFVVPPRKPELLGTALETLVKDKLLRSRMGRAGRERIDTEFHPRRQFLKTLEVLEAAAARRRRRRTHQPGNRPNDT